MSTRTRSDDKEEQDRSSGTHGKTRKLVCLFALMGLPTVLYVLSFLLSCKDSAYITLLSPDIETPGPKTLVHHDN